MNRIVLGLFAMALSGVLSAQAQSPRGATINPDNSPIRRANPNRLQGTQPSRWLSDLITALANAQAARRAQKEADTAATKVEFFTLVRGEN